MISVIKCRIGLSIEAHERWGLLMVGGKEVTRKSKQGTTKEEEPLQRRKYMGRGGL